jgi:RHS repeat-associated protein
MADDPCEAAVSAADPTGPRKYYRARYYDPKIGRFLSEDPIGFVGGDNFYVYAENNPTTLVDPLGLSPGSTLGGDDPAFKDRKKFIEDLEKQLRDPNLTQREREKIKRRLKELRRRPSDRQQHHMEPVPQPSTDSCGKEYWEVCYGPICFPVVCNGPICVPEIPPPPPVIAPPPFVLPPVPVIP